MVSTLSISSIGLLILLSFRRLASWEMNNHTYVHIILHICSPKNFEDQLKSPLSVGWDEKRRVKTLIRRDKDTKLEKKMVNIIFITWLTCQFISHSFIFSPLLSSPLNLFFQIKHVIKTCDSCTLLVLRDKGKTTAQPCTVQSTAILFKFLKFLCNYNFFFFNSIQSLRYLLKKEKEKEM